MNAGVGALNRWVDRLADSAVTDPVVDGLDARVGALPEVVRSTLHGSWLGIPLHPILTDATIGSWTSSFVADLVGGHAARPLARRLVLLGCLTAVPTVATGLVDWTGLSREARRVGLVHASTNLAATMLYLRSYRARRRGRHGAGVAWGVAAGTVATVGAHLGGILVFRDWTEAGPAPESHRGGPPSMSFAPESVRIG